VGEAVVRFLEVTSIYQISDKSHKNKHKIR